MIVSKGKKMALSSIQSITTIQKQASVCKTWNELGLDPSLLETDYESVQFLVKQRLIFSIIGFQHTSIAGQKQKLQIDDGKISILVNSTYTKVHELIGKFVFDKEQAQLIHTETKKSWNYLGTTGLTQIDQYNYNELVPVTKLSPKEMESLLNHAKKFDTSKNATCVLQVITHPEKTLPLPQTPLLHGLDFLSPFHVSLHLIDNQGNAYSTAFAEIPQEKEVYKSKIHKLFATYNGIPCLIDYEEFRQHKMRVVTSIPLSQPEFDSCMDLLKKMKDQTVRFNFCRQNCSAFCCEILKQAGIKLDNRLSLGQLVTRALPSPANYQIFQNIFSIWKHLEKNFRPIKTLRKVCHKVTYILFTPIRISAQFVTNLFLLMFGGGKGSSVPQGSYDGTFLHPIKSEISSIKELFSAKPTTIPHCGPIIKWQLKQKSTELYQYSGPKMDILPQQEKDRTSMPSYLRPYTNILF